MFNEFTNLLSMSFFTGMKPRRRHIFLLVFILLPALTNVAAHPPGDVTIIDESHYSNVFGETRNYRVFLPPGYFEREGKRFPVIYFFHGWSQRYFGSSNPYGDFDKDDDNGGDNIASFVKSHEAIVVKPDGYNRSAEEPYYVRPYNVTPVETYRQFPIYFPELVGHIDARYRTIADREHRGIAGLSMGGFMTFWIGGKYPHLLSAAGSFCGSPEFTVGPKNFPVEYRHLDMFDNYGGMNVRLHYGDKDFIRGYHEDLNRVWPEVIDNYSYKIFNAAHSTCGLGEMLGFILETFGSPPAKPSRWDHTDVYPEFSVWDYQVTTDRTVPGFTTIGNVDIRGFRCSVREFLPDGGCLPSVKVSVKTAPVYGKNQVYVINDINLATAAVFQQTVRSDDNGAITIHLDGGPHEIGINKRTDKPNLVVASYTLKDTPWATAGDDVTLNLQIMNKGLSQAQNIRVNVAPVRATTSVVSDEVLIDKIPVNGISTAAVTFKASADTIEIAKLRITLQDDRRNEWTGFIEVPLKRKRPSFDNFVIADGKVFTVAKSGIDTETVKLGKGNGDGIANPGELIVILVEDQGRLWRTDVTGNDPYINPDGQSIRKSDDWSSFDHVGASAKYDVPVISSHTPREHQVQLLAEYWLPEYPLHISRQGVVSFQITGRDTTPPEIDRVQVTGDNVLQIRLYDGGKIAAVKATLTDEKDPKRSVSTILTDDGKNGDRAGGDHVFSQTIPEQGFGIFRVVVEAEDEFGNGTVLEADQHFVLH